MKKQVNYLIRGLMAMIILVGVSACQETNENDLEFQAETSKVLIDIDVSRLLAEGVKTQEVPEFVMMYNGEANHSQGTNGEADLITEVSPGDELIWELGSAEGVTIIGFEFFSISGDDAFVLPGGFYPELQPDGSWKARVSPNVQGAAELKYNVHFELNGEAYWWDPIVKISSGGQ